jgi:hypothetical protein
MKYRNDCVTYNEFVELEISAAVSVQLYFRNNEGGIVPTIQSVKHPCSNLVGQSTE